MWDVLGSTWLARDGPLSWCGCGAWLVECRYEWWRCTAVVRESKYSYVQVRLPTILLPGTR